MSAVPASDIMLAAALVFGLAMACQVIAPKLHMPALVLLLPVGFLLGLAAPQLRVDTILGSAFPVIVSLVVAVILFQGGMGLTSIPLKGTDRRVARHLVLIGGTITALCSSLAAHFILGMDWPMAFMLGTIVIVSGPTVVTPILQFVRPRKRVGGILIWEGTLLDPLGALVAVVVFQLVKASAAESLVDGIVMFALGVLTAVVAAVFGVVLFVVGGKLVKGSTLLGTQVLLGSVIVAAALADSVTDDSGLLTALLMGFTAPHVARHFGASLDPCTPFFDTIVSISIGVLFISIAALVPYATLAAVIVPTLVIAVILILVVRPLVATVCTIGAELSLRERAFIAWMDPRGIVAAATASSVGATLVSLNVPDANYLLPAAFVIIAVTVTVYGLTAVPVAKLLGVRQDAPAPAEAPAPTG
ncbi:MAG: cation:proton antiporter [Candidatus Nanopelagicales bacterium]